MKRMFLIAALSLASLTTMAQDVDPLNFSGKMYVESIIAFSTPRYVSYENHAILSKDITIPILEITTCILDFENGVISIDDKEYRIKVTSAKVYDDYLKRETVIYMDMLDCNDKMELIWPEHGQPYIQQITGTSDGVNIARCMLTTKPVIADPEHAIIEALMTLGNLR